MADPIPMRLRCEMCGALHIDEGEFATKPHHTHSCQECGLTWRPAVVCTVGVAFLPGFKSADPAVCDAPGCEGFGYTNPGKHEKDCVKCGGTGRLEVEKGGPDEG